MEQFDVIVVGGRVAGSTLAFELSRAGYKVLLLDKAVFPSDTLSTHNFMGNSLAMLREMGVLDKLLATGTPTYNRAVIQFEDAVIDGRFPEVNGETECLCIRRTLLDETLFRHAAAEPGVTAIEGFRMTGITWNCDTVTGIEGVYRNGDKARFGAKLVVGADGRRSAVREMAGSSCLISVPTDFASYIGYYENYKQDGDAHTELYKIGSMLAIVFPTSDNLHVVGVMFPLEDEAWRSRFLQSPDEALPEIAASGLSGTPLARRLRGATLSGKVRGLLGYDNDWHQGMGPGWALVGDALSFKDPAVGQGMPDAIYSARILTSVLGAYGNWADNWGEMEAAYQQAVQEQMMSRFQMACQFTKNVPFSPEQRFVNQLIAANAEATSAFLGIYNHAVEPQQFEAVLGRLIAAQGMGEDGNAAEAGKGS